jgi:hypothetical protein
MLPTQLRRLNKLSGGIVGIVRIVDGEGGKSATSVRIGGPAVQTAGPFS